MKRRYNDGGMTPVSGAPTSAFSQANPSYGGSSGLNNNAPLVAITNAPMAGETPQPMRKGGKVKSASARADGCAIRGKTRAR